MRQTLLTLLFSFILPVTSFAADDGLVVVELFTSQSCSSCPAADRALRQIQSERSDVLVLSHHVDYWNHLSWKDTLSRPEATQRQRGYAKALSLRGLYTPQAVVQGQSEAVGSQKAKVERLINASDALIFSALDTEKGYVALSTVNPRHVKGAEVVFVEYIDHSAVLVERGENAHKSLAYVNSVTNLTSLGHWRAKEDFTARVPEYDVNKSYALIIQQPNQGKILGAMKL